MQQEIPQIEAIVFLQSVDLFSFCKAEEVLRIASIAKQRTFEEGEKIYAQSDSADKLYCVVRGSVKLESQSGENEVIGPLHTFGVMEILSGRLRTGSATAAAETLTLAIEADDFFDLLANNIEIVKALFRHLIQGFQDRAAGEGVA